MKKRVYDDDDGRTVADMSGVERQPLLLPRFRKKERDGEERTDAVPEEEWSREDRRAVIFGSIGAVLLIGVIFLAAAAAVIALLLTLWR